MVPNKHAGRNFSAELINVQFLITRVGREKSRKLIKCAAQLFRTTEYATFVAKLRAKLQKIWIQLNVDLT